MAYIVFTQKILPSFDLNKYIDLERSIYFKHAFYICLSDTCHYLSMLITVKDLHQRHKSIYFIDQTLK